MTHKYDGQAIVYCEGDFATPSGKTAHGLVRHTARYKVLSVIDSRYAGQDALMVLDNRMGEIPVYASIDAAIKNARSQPTHLVIGLAPDGGQLPEAARAAIQAGIEHGLNVDCGLHDFLTEDAKITALAQKHGVVLRDIRKPPPRSELHFFSGVIEQVLCPKIAVLGTDSAVGKRTTAVKLVEGLNQWGCKSFMIGTGQTAWLQGVRYSYRYFHCHISLQITVMNNPLILSHRQPTPQSFD